MLAEELGGTSPETSWPKRFHHLQMKRMTPSVAASQCSSAAALARGLHVDVILPVETHPKNIVQDRVEPLRASSAPPDLISFRHMPHFGVPLQIWDTGGARWCHRGGMRSICRGVYGRWFVSRGIGADARISKRSFYVLAARESVTHFSCQMGPARRLMPLYHPRHQLTILPLYIVWRELLHFP